MMREFEYFLFENFDADQEAHNPSNPRKILGKDTDDILSQVADNHTVDAYQAVIERLIAGGVLRHDGEKLAFDCPVFLKEDAAFLHSAVREKAAVLADMLARQWGALRASCAKKKMDSVWNKICTISSAGWYLMDSSSIT